MLEAREFYINGQWVAPGKINNFEVINPSTEDPFAVISLGDHVDTNAAVKAASVAFDGWSQTSKQERLTLLTRLADIYQRRFAEMGEAISMEMGSPISAAYNAQADSGICHLRYFIRVCEDFVFEQPLGEHALDNYIIYEPVGVCGLITPWNWPMNQVVLKVVPALAVGCTMVLKPSEIAPISAKLFAEMIDEAGFPAGVFNLVNGDGDGVGTQLSGHADVDMISFTGSTRAGIAISKNAADTIKRVSLELGGKGANIIFADADDQAVIRGVQDCFNNTGQSCNAPTRMLVERAIYEQALEQARQTSEKTSVGLAAKTGQHLGPVVSKSQFDKVQHWINRGIKEGARLIAGGLGRPAGLERGYFVKPTVFADVNNTMAIAREEIFGPILCIIPFDSEDEAIHIANDTVYGLTNYVQTQDMKRAKRITRQLRSGMVEINGKALDGGSPFGGYKQSGNSREGGVWGLESFLEVKAISGWDSP